MRSAVGHDVSMHRRSSKLRKLTQTFAKERSFAQNCDNTQIKAIYRFCAILRKLRKFALIVQRKFA